MKNKKIFIIVLSTILVILIILVSYILFFRNKNVENSNNIQNPIENNQETPSLELENSENNENSENSENNENKYTEEEKNAGLNVEVEGIKYCRYNEECFKEIFLNCEAGSHIYYMDETSPYNFMIMSEYEDNCLLLIQDLKNTGSENINCQIPLTEMTEDTLNKFLSLDQENINKYCK